MTADLPPAVDTPTEDVAKTTKKALRKAGAEGNIMDKKSPDSFGERLIGAALAEPAGIPTLARRVGCSVLTARKHLQRAYESGALPAHTGPRGMVYGTGDSGGHKGEPQVARKTPKAQGPWGKKKMVVLMNGNTTKIVAITVSHRRVRTATGHVGTWDPDLNAYKTEDGLVIGQE